MSPQWIAALLLLANLQIGHAAYYNPQIFEQVVAVRLAGWTAGSLTEDDLRGVIGYVAVPDCNEIGRRVWLFHESEGWRGPYLVADCANHIENHHVRMRKRGIICEVDFQTAKRWGILGMGPQHIDVAMVSWE